MCISCNNYYDGDCFCDEMLKAESLSYNDDPQDMSGANDPCGDCNLCNNTNYEHECPLVKKHNEMIIENPAEVISNYVPF